MGYFSVQEIEVDSKSISKRKKLIYKLNNILVIIALFALNKLRKVHLNDYPEPLSKKLFTENKHFIFDQLTYYRYYTIFRRLFFPFRCQSKIIYTNNVAIVIEEIKENSSESNIKYAINNINHSCRELRDNKHLYKNPRRFAIKLLSDTKIKIHRIIIQDTSNHSACYKNDLYFIHDNHEIIHIFKKNDYYFVTNLLLSPVEMHHYLCFRAWLCERRLSALTEISEHSMLGQYLLDEKDAIPDNHYAKFAENLDVGLSQWETILSSLYNATAGSSKLYEMEYHFILTHIANLRLDELILFRDKFMQNVENIKIKHSSHKAEIDILCPFGFVFIEQASSNNGQLAYPHHYDAVFKAYCHEHRLKRCIAIIFTPSLTRQNQKAPHIHWWISEESSIQDPLNSA